MKSVLSLLLLLYISIRIFGQDLNESDIKSRAIANNLIEKHFREKSKGCPNLVFSIADTWFLFLVEKNNIYVEYYVHRLDSTKSEILRTTVIKKSLRIVELRKAFNCKIYKEGYITFNTPFYEDGYELANGNLTYFRFQDKTGKIFGESRLSIIVKPNPIDQEVYTYFVNSLLKLISDPDTPAPCQIK